MTKKDYTAVGEGWIGPLPEILTVEELAQFLREGTGAIRRKLNRPGQTDFPNVFRDGNRLKIPRVDVENYIQMRYGDTRTETQRQQESGNE